MIYEKNVRAIADLLKIKKSGFVSVNPEYQRGTVWTDAQKKKLIDSILRGYPLPVFYFHHKSVSVSGMKSEHLEIVDGQQRLTAIYEFSEGAFKLFDPVKDAQKARFPSFIRTQPCPWAGKSFDQFDDELKQQFLSTELSVAAIKTEDDNEVRDLFIRLQGGQPLNHQETRDAWPGNFTDFILKLGGKPDIARYPGHPFFRTVLGLKGTGDRGKARQLAAQIAVLFFNRRHHGPDYYADINAAALDEFYYSNLDFDRDSIEARRLINILDVLERRLGDGKRPKLRGHDAIHLVLLVDDIMDDYAPSWEHQLGGALDLFLHGFNNSKVNGRDGVPDDFWNHYGQWTRVASDKGDTLARRHRFYTEKMFEYMPELVRLDPKRGFTDLERIVLYYRFNRACSVCGKQVDWNDLEVHHVQTHVSGGSTRMDNAAIVHRACHPKSKMAAAEFSERFSAGAPTAGSAGRD